jgi:hypothetical protein
VIKRLWQFPAVIGGTAVLTFCGVSSLQASMNGPLHAFGASVEAARASASTGAAAQPIAAGAPVYRTSDGEAASATSTVQAAGAVTEPPADPCATTACRPSGEAAAAEGPPPSGRGGSHADAAEPDDAAQPDDPAEQADAPPGRDVTSPGLAAVAPGRGEGAPGHSGAAPGQAIKNNVSTAASAARAAADTSRQLTQELNRWLRLSESPGLGVKAGQDNGKKAQAPSGARKGQR